MTLLTAPRVQKTKQQTACYCCELADRETDWEGVTLYAKMIDVIIADLAREAIADLIAGGYEWKEQKYQKQKYRFFGLTTTICKFAQKPALIATVLASCEASQFFISDLDMGGEE